MTNIDISDLRKHRDTLFTDLFRASHSGARIAITGDTFDATDYDEWNGVGAAQKVVTELRSRLAAEAAEAAKSPASTTEKSPWPDDPFCFLGFQTFQ